MQAKLTVADFRNVAKQIPDSLGEFDDTSDSLIFRLPTDLDGDHALTAHQKLQVFANITLSKLCADLSAKGTEKRGKAGREARKKGTAAESGSSKGKSQKRARADDG